MSVIRETLVKALDIAYKRREMLGMRNCYGKTGMEMLEMDRAYDNAVRELEMARAALSAFDAASDSEGKA